MYKAPKFVKVSLNAEESFTTYECQYRSDGEAHWVFTGDDCEEYKVESGMDVSGTVASFAPWQCWLSPSA